MISATCRLVLRTVFLALVIMLARPAPAGSAAKLWITDVTPCSFSLVWIANQAATCSAKVYTDPEGEDVITGLSITDESAGHPPAAENGVMKVRVSGLSPQTTYYFRTVTITSQGELVEPVGNELPSVQTELSSIPVTNDLLAHRIVKSDGATPAVGALLLGEVEGGSYPITGWVGDGVPAPWALLDLNNVYSRTDHLNLELAGGEVITLVSLGGSLGSKRLIGTVPTETGGIETLDPEPDDEQCTLELPNNAPTVPAVNYPSNGSETTSLTPILSVNNSTDPDGHTLSYIFEVYSDEGLRTLVTTSQVQGGENTTEWQVDIALDDNSSYYWRAKAYDEISYSEWMDKARFFVNTSNDPPFIPIISSPPDGSEVTSLHPLLEVTNATDIDLDPLTYEFELYAHENGGTVLSSKEGVLEGSSGNTSWHIDISLEDNTFYWWRAQARDNEDKASGWTDLFAFFVNTANEAPGAPSLRSPQDGEEVDTLVPYLEINNATDLDLDSLTYFFEVDKVHTFDSASLERASDVVEGLGAFTSWNPSDLDDNTLYYWRARAYDGASYSQWVTGSFFVNLFNDAPSSPTINNPGNNSEVTTFTPTLAANPSTDVDFDQITYQFGLYSDVGLSNLVTSASCEDPSWQVDVSLADNTEYYWRARAVDEHGATAAWSATMCFFVNMRNDEPTAPTLNNPVGGGVVTSLMPTVSVNNSTDLDNNVLIYEFELYADRNLSEEVASATVSQGNLITSWTVSPTLTDDTAYYWRARVNDGQLTSSWMPTAVFVVHTSGAQTTVEIEASQDVSASAQTTQVVEVTDDNSPIDGVCVEIPQGALSDSCTITIGVVANPPTFPADTKAIGKAIEFGPAGITFSTPVSLVIPYTQEDLVNAGVRHPADLQLFMYDTSTLSWEEIPVDSVDEVNSRLICKVGYFSMYGMGKVLASPEPDTGSIGGGSGGCFIASALFD
jgi:hypothetical protein